jgi:uncharacterized protein YecE (DUF72 family)
MTDLVPIAIGTAGWNIRSEHKPRFPSAGTHLERYARRLNAVEINSSFYRPHRPTTYERWAASVPSGFRFAVKVPKEITHTKRLSDAAEDIDRFCGQCEALGDRLGPLLVQLPPSLRYQPEVARPFFAALRDRFRGNVACEPRHASWFTSAVDQELVGFGVARVAADPAPVPGAKVPGGWPGLVYYRLHGSPKIYYSAYEPEVLGSVARNLVARADEGGAVWCIFDNTALGAATENALSMRELVQFGLR